MLFMVVAPVTSDHLASSPGACCRLTRQVAVWTKQTQDTNGNKHKHTRHRNIHRVPQNSKGMSAPGPASEHSAAQHMGVDMNLLQANKLLHAARVCMCAKCEVTFGSIWLLRHVRVGFPPFLPLISFSIAPEKMAWCTCTWRACQGFVRTPIVPFQPVLYLSTRVTAL